jgi:hypothetical protein
VSLTLLPAGLVLRATSLESPEGLFQSQVNSLHASSLADGHRAPHAMNDDWSRGAREYIEQAADGQDIDMTIALKRYREVAGSFNDWFVNEMQKHRKDLLDDFDARRLELMRLERL